jgi:hypothetical protein
MKKQVLFFILFLFTTFSSMCAENIILNKIITPTIPGRPRAPMLIPVTVDLSTTELYLNFTTSVGVATITVTDINGTIVEQESVDTDTSNELSIPVDGWATGGYTITISYGSITLAGEFVIE